ncbi:polysaccharide pyruvyl transferase family protein [Microbacterium esteraromaticum]|uniref:Polysaccharide pyruvyl transferase family protein n=1 Tax=Microbacterium esteraromaticum TaxID=57043 RepID=A0A939DU98_9MICO|nr:polysaccharide pyruvyl transferase family protein [Microbacterium esteraromaticum]MBN8415470.1 polysaccharide pyruvyl transferase family protein [Microbacterium esteraromaticum]
MRRRMRQARRLGAAALQPRAWGAPVVPAYWWDGHPNFGDALTPWLLPKYGIVPLYREPRHARLIGVGSLLEFCAEDYDGAIWGTGLMTDVERRMPNVQALAVRGPLTAERIDVSGAAYGDPGLLVSRHVARPARRAAIAAVPHGHHRSHAGLTALLKSEPGRVRDVNVHREAAPTVREIAGCETVLTTSLHGLITADAYGIPAVWTALEPALTGGTFKFHDYEAAVTPGRTRYVDFDDLRTLDDVQRFAWAADASRVAELSRGLEAALPPFAGAAAPITVTFPRGITRAFRGE